MTNSSELVAVELTERERKFIQQALQQWGLSASDAPFPFQVRQAKRMDIIRMRSGNAAMRIELGVGLPLGAEGYRAAVLGSASGA